MSNAREDADYWQLTRAERLRYYRRLLDYAWRRSSDAAAAYEQGDYARSARRRLDALLRQTESLLNIMWSRHWLADNEE